VFWGTLRSFLYAAVFMLVARQIFAGAADYEASYRVVAYATAPMAFMFLPFIGGLTFLYTLFLVIVGLERVNGFDAVKSVLTVLLASVVIAALGWVFGLPGHGAHGYYHHGITPHGFFPGCHR
jgi:hypothetical protein